MRAEDIKDGMWVMWHGTGTTVKIVQRNEVLQGYNIRRMGGEPGVLQYSALDLVEPWVPRVGEWVRNLSDTIAPVVGIRHATENCEAVAILGHPSGCTWCVKDLEPCAPPEAKQAERVRAEATLEIDWVPYDPAKALDFIAAHQLRELSVAYSGPVEGEVLCPRCEADEAEAWREFDRASNDHEAAIETLRAMLLEHACGLAEGARELRREGEASGHLEPRACIAIALALLL